MGISNAGRRLEKGAVYAKLEFRFGPDFQWREPRGMRTLIATAVFALLLSSAEAHAQQALSSQARSLVFVELAAERGLQCGLLTRWQAATLRAQVADAMTDWDAESRSEAARQVKEQAAETPCDSEAITIWIEAARRGLESEYLSPYLVIYRTVARLQPPPEAFSAVALRLDPTPAIAAIDAKLAALEASGATAEGGKPWPDYIAGIESAVQDLVEALRTGHETGGFEPGEAAAYLAQSALITELWLEEEGLSEMENGN